MRQFKIKNGKLIAHVYLFTDYSAIKIKEEMIKSIVNEIKFLPIGYAGFKSKVALKRHLYFEIFGYDSYPVDKLIFDQKSLLKQIKIVIKKCNHLAPSSAIHIFVFPCFNKFVIDKMNGVAGFCAWKKTVLLYINPIRDWENMLKQTLCHEYAHAISLNYHKVQTVLDRFIFEGLAEHFREAVLGGKSSILVNSLSKKSSNLLLKKLKNKLQSKNDKLKTDLFFGTGTYPQWAGYSIGYYLVEDCVYKIDKTGWGKILKFGINKKHLKFFTTQ